MKKAQRLISLVVCVCAVLSLAPGASAAANVHDVVAAQWEAALFIMRDEPRTELGSGGGDLAVVALARSEHDIPATYYDAYQNGLAATMRDMCGVIGRFDYSAYARTSLALTSIGVDPSWFGGWNFIIRLADEERVLSQGTYGAALALLALDARQTPMPADPNAKKLATRDGYVNHILAAQRADGGFDAYGGANSVVVTALALSAISGYEQMDGVAEAVDKAAFYLSGMQQPGGGYSGSVSVTAQVVVALCGAGIDPESDQRFIKDGGSPIDAIMACRVTGGGFANAPGGAPTADASAYALSALSALRRVQRGHRALLDMLDVTMGAYPGADDADFVPLPIMRPDGAFTDIDGSRYKSEIEELARRGLISGMTETEFMPDLHIRRAEIAAMLANAMGLRQVSETPFADLAQGEWYTGLVGAAYQSGLVTGVTATQFSPMGYVTREQAAVMLSRAALRLGAETSMPAEQVTQALAAFTDGASCSLWARGGLAYGVKAGIIPADGALRPRENATRGEVAHMLYKLLQNAGLI